MKIGRVSENVLKRSILQQIRTKRDEVMIGAGIGMDCAIFAFSKDTCPEDGDDRVIIECVQEGFIDGAITPLLQKCVNILAARGAEPISVSLSLLLPAEMPEQTLKASMAEAEGFCHVLQIQISEAGGRVSEAVLKPYAVVTAYGKARRCARCGKAEDAYHMVGAARPEQDIVISKWIGLEGTAILAKRYAKSLLERYPAWLVEGAESFDKYLSTVPEAAVAIQCGACAIYNVSEGGIFAALWELAEGAGVGLTVDLRKLPLKQETVEICNHCNVNPYELLSGGCLLMTCRDGTELVAALAEAGICAVTAGKITDSRDRLILNENEVRYLDRPHTDEIYRIKIGE